MWWGLHYGGRGGPTCLAISAVDMALWDLRTRRLKQPLWRALGGHDPKVKVYAGGIDLQFPLDKLEVVQRTGPERVALVVRFQEVKK